MILDDHGNNLDSFRTSLESSMSCRGPLLLRPVTGQELFLAVSYSKPALVFSQFCPNNQLFIVDGNSNFFLPVKILENTPSKVERLSKLAKNFQYCPDYPTGPNLKLCFLQILLYKDFGGRQDAVQKPPSNFTSN